jgi:hypothetical protein
MHTRDDAWIALDCGFKTFMDSLGHLTEEELTATEVVGKWSAKDVVAHMWVWVDEALVTVKAWNGKRPWQEGVTYDDEWNEKQVESRSVLPLINVVDGLTTAHRRLIRELDRVEDTLLAQKGKEPRGTEMSLVDFYYFMAKHYQEHAADLKNYQERCLGECD